MSGFVNKSTIATPLSTTIVFTDPQEDKMVNDCVVIVHIVLLYCYHCIVFFTIILES